MRNQTVPSQASQPFFWPSSSARLRRAVRGSGRVPVPPRRGRDNAEKMDTMAKKSAQLIRPLSLKVTSTSPIVGKDVESFITRSTGGEFCAPRPLPASCCSAGSTIVQRGESVPGRIDRCVGPWHDRQRRESSSPVEESPFRTGAELVREPNFISILLYVMLIKIPNEVAVSQSYGRWYRSIFHRIQP